jgi:hypothetical protein
MWDKELNCTLVPTGRLSKTKYWFVSWKRCLKLCIYLHIQWARVLTQLIFVSSLSFIRRSPLQCVSIVCDLEISRVKWPTPDFGWCATAKEVNLFINVYQNSKTTSPMRSAKLMPVRNFRPQSSNLCLLFFWVVPMF